MSPCGLPGSLFLLLSALAIQAALQAAPVQLTHGPGNDTEARWSPDGRRIVFQTDREGDLDLALLDLESGETRLLVSGPGHACFPTWSPDGRWIAYASARFTHTAVEGLQNGYNLFVVPAAGGEPRRLTSGLYRDYCPVFSRDGQSIIFSSTRGTKTNAVSLYSVPLSGGDPQPVLQLDADDAAAVQPDLSPDGRHLVFGYIAGFRANWGLRLAKTAQTADVYPLTDPQSPFYGPRWSPDGRLLACTGFRPGDPGWRVYLVEVSTGRVAPLETSPGNARSPSWSPDGRELVYECNQSGTYKLHRLAVPAVQFEHTAEVAAGGPPILQYTFEREPADRVPNQSGPEYPAQVAGRPEWRDGGLTFPAGSYLTVPAPAPLAFGGGPFSARAEVLVERHTDQLRLIAVGDYPGNRQGWQMFLGTDNRAHFNSRRPDLTYCGAVSDGPLPTGRKVTLLGLRTERGSVRLYVDGLLQASTCPGASVEYGTPNQLRLGAQFNGSAPLTDARLYGLAIYPRALTWLEARGTSLADYLSR